MFWCLHEVFVTLAKTDLFVADHTLLCTWTMMLNKCLIFVSFVSYFSALVRFHQLAIHRFFCFSIGLFLAENQILVFLFRCVPFKKCAVFAATVAVCCASKWKSQATQEHLMQLLDSNVNACAFDVTASSAVNLRTFLLFPRECQCECDHELRDNSDGRFCG